MPLVVEHVNVAILRSHNNLSVPITVDIPGTQRPHLTIYVIIVPAFFTFSCIDIYAIVWRGRNDLLFTTVIQVICAYNFVSLLCVKCSSSLLKSTIIDV